LWSFCVGGGVDAGIVNGISPTLTRFAHAYTNLPNLHLNTAWLGRVGRWRELGEGEYGPRHWWLRKRRQEIEEASPREYGESGWAEWQSGRPARDRQPDGGTGWQQPAGGRGSVSVFSFSIGSHPH
jgi:hypothetical protein